MCVERTTRISVDHLAEPGSDSSCRSTPAHRKRKTPVSRGLAVTELNAKEDCDPLDTRDLRFANLESLGSEMNAIVPQGID